MAAPAPPLALNPRSLLFTLYGDYVRPLGQRDVRVGALVRLAAELGVGDNALRSALSRMTREGWLAARRDGGPPRYHLSPRGEDLIEEGTRRIYGHRAAWDGRWLLVSYSLPEPRRGQRDRLRQGLSFLGLGSLGNGLFVTPHDLRAQVRDLIRRCGVEADVTLHHGTLEWPADPAQVVARAWDLDRLSGRYAEFLARTTASMRDRGATRDDRAAFERRFLLTHEFRRFPFSDPDLPDALLPPGWVGTAAREAFLEYNARLRAPAERFYRSIADVETIVENGDRTATTSTASHGGS